MSDTTYTFSPRHGRGVLMGLGPAQLIAMGGAILGALVCVLTGLNSAAAVLCLALGLSVALVKVGGRHLHAWVGPLGHFGLLPRRWRAPLTTAPRSATRQGAAAVMPIELGDVAFLGVAHHGGEVGLATYRRPRYALVWTLAVEGPRFRLASDVDQARAVAGWGEVLAGSAREHSPLRRLQVIERAVADTSAARSQIPARVGRQPRADALAVYDSNCAAIAAESTRHEVFVSGVVEPRRGGDSGLDEALAELDDAADRLQASGFRASPLAVPELADLVRSTIDPAVRLNDRPSATEAAETERLPDGRRVWNDDRGYMWVEPPAGDGAAAPGGQARSALERARPMARDTGWSWVRTDSAFHAVFEVTELPRVPVGPEWAWPLVVGEGLGADRTLSIHIELSPPSRALRRAERSVMAHDDDHDHRQRWGFRSGARVAREDEAAQEREEELVAGYADARFAVLVGVSAPSVEELEHSARALCHRATLARLELRRLYGQQDLALGAILPLGRCRLAGGWG